MLNFRNIVRFENGGSLNIVRIGNGISYIGFNRTRYEDNQQGGVFFVYCLTSIQFHTI